MEIKFFSDSCAGSLGQRWQINRGVTEVRVGGGYCLDAKTGESFWESKMQVSEFHSWIVDSGSPVVIWQCNGNPWQRWSFYNDHTLRLAANQSASLSKLYIYLLTTCRFILILLDLCLDVPNSSNNNGVQVQTYACNGGANQAWLIQ